MVKYAHRRTFWCAAMIVGFLRIWAYRYYVNPDGVSYIELAWAGLWHGLGGFVNGYWSPLYPALLSLAFRIAKPGLASESTIVHWLNFAVFLFNLACFEFFLRELLALRRGSTDPADGRQWLPEQVVWTWGYVFFLWASVVWLTPALVSPDLCAAAFAYLATAILLRIHRGGGSWTTYLFLGAVLGLAYWAKAFMFLLAWVFLACSLWAARSKRLALPRVVAATLIFLIIAAPEILALSRSKGRWTFGDTGALNYAWYVDRIPGAFWQGGPPRAGAPTHPVREILNSPATFEFTGPVEGSYPPSHDPSYWDEGLHPYFSFRGELRVLARSASFFLQMFSRTGALYAAFLVLFLLLRRSGRWNGPEPRPWSVWLPCVAALGIYALVQVDPRFVGEFALMLLMGLLAAVRPARQRIESHIRLITVALISVAAIAVFWSAGENGRRLVSPRPAPQFQVARYVDSLALFPRNPSESAREKPVGYAGTIGDGADSYWAHLEGVRIIAGVPNEAAFWQADEAAQARVMAEFARLGIRFVAAEIPHPSGPMSNWTRVPGTDFYIYRLDSRPAPAAEEKGASLPYSSPGLSAVNLPVGSANRSSSRDTSR